jgi:hypothetical protein
MPLIDAQQDRWTALIDANHRTTHVTHRCVSLNDACHSTMRIIEQGKPSTREPRRNP